ncbi:hypothetical protein [Pseudomonas sp. RC10]|uniref:hypothetical protein n=1 Tax=Pseudomonas bambusae TaxID=3139142 RepID=UPI0031392BFE
MKVKVTNNGQCPRGVWSMGTIKLVAVGAFREVPMSDVELEHNRSIEALQIDELASAPTDEKQDLLTKLKALGIDAGANSRVDTLQKKLDEALAAKAAADTEAEQKSAVVAELKGLNVEFDESAPVADLQAKLAAAKA